MILAVFFTFPDEWHFYVYMGSRFSSGGGGGRDTRVNMFSAAIFFSDNSYNQNTTNKYMYWCRLYFLGMYSTIWFVLQKWCFVNVARVCTTSVNRWLLLVSGELYIDKALRTIFVCLSYTVSKRCCANVRKVPLYLSRYAAVYNCRLTK